jgi:small-conductance mechanosensitive channel
VSSIAGKVGEKRADRINNPIVAAIIGDQFAENQIRGSIAYRLFRPAAHPCEETFMFDWQDLFQWDRFITPTIIKIFYWLAIVLAVLYGLSGVFAGLASMAINPFAGFVIVLASLAGILIGVIFSRIAAEFILIVFRINEHLGAIRDQGDRR